MKFALLAVLATSLFATVPSSAVLGVPQVAQRIPLHDGGWDIVTVDRDGAFADEARHRAYIPSGGDGTLTVIDTSGPLARKTATVQTQPGARTGALDPSTGIIYSPTEKFGPPPAGGGRPALVPGSVELLVIR